MRSVPRLPTPLRLQVILRRTVFRGHGHDETAKHALPWPAARLLHKTAAAKEGRFFISRPDRRSPAARVGVGRWAKQISMSENIELARRLRHLL